MNGAESLVRTLIASGVDTCFANPGTSEMHFVAALDDVELDIGSLFRRANRADVDLFHALDVAGH